MIMKQELRPSIVFSTMPVFDMLRQQLHMANYRVIQFIDAKVSVRLWFLVISTTALIVLVIHDRQLDRINDFLHNVRLFAVIF